MPRAELPSGIVLEYETFGNSDDPTLLLVNGYTSQLTGWDEGVCARFVDQGLHVVRYDNRDVGLSTSFAGAPVDAAGACYRVSDMVGDGISVLDALGVRIGPLLTALGVLTTLPGLTKRRARELELCLGGK